MPAVSSSAADSGRVRRAAVVGIAGTRLGEAERALFAKAPPLGFILFKRNCQSCEQVRALVSELRAALSDPAAPVFVDQEGGRVARLCPPAWPARLPARRIGELAERNREAGLEAAWLQARVLACDLADLGITVNCAPVLDLAFPGQTEAIGDRAFCADPELVGELGRAMIDGLLAGGVLPVIKHLPGHGRARVDSHLELPVVDANAEVMAASDWRPFRICRDAPFGMSAHVLYPALDPAAPATHSARVIGEVVRRRIGFAGALLSDDLSMGALGGSLGERTARARAAGCDLALHCNGDLAEMTEVLEAAGELDRDAGERVEQALAARPEPQPFDAPASEQRLAFLLGGGEEPRVLVG